VAAAAPPSAANSPSATIEKIMVAKPAQGYWNYAREFLSAAEVINRSEPGECLIPKYYLVCHALELGLKAFLNHKGISVKVLRSKKYGHDLRALFSLARQLGLRKEFHYTSAQWRAIRNLYSHYHSKSFEYLKVGYKTWPPYQVIQSAVAELLGGISPAIRGRAGLR